MNDEYDEEYENEIFEDYKQASAVFQQNLPAVVQQFQKSAMDISHFNETPAVISFFTILGQLCKDFIAVPFEEEYEDSRIHFLHIQTSGTGKTTLSNFVQPIARSVFEKVNAKKKHSFNTNVEVPVKDNNGNIEKDADGNAIMHYARKHFDVFSVQVATSAALVGHYALQDEMETDDNGNSRLTGKKIQVKMTGALEGSGLAHWDEFERSGIFSPNSHQVDMVVFLNTMLNSLHGESWVMKKQLKEGDMVETFGERSVLAMTYPPTELNRIMTETGLLQRMLCYIREVPEAIQHNIRKKKISKFGKFKDRQGPMDKFSEEFMKMYDLVLERYEEKLKEGKSEIETKCTMMEYTESANALLDLEYENMVGYINDCGLFVREVANLFINRLYITTSKLAVLCAIAQAPYIKDKSKRFQVTGQNVRQAGAITRQCYISLVEWLERSLKERRMSSPIFNTKPFKEKYEEMAKKTEDGWVNRKLFISEMCKEIKKSNSQTNLIFKNKVVQNFEIKKIGRGNYIKLKEVKL
tara:strand:- start:1165 stop:2739 length:1575 start_codon:yes stop_codon:yes gene_type:complete